MTREIEVMRVGAGTDVAKLAHAITGEVRAHGRTRLHCVGANAVNQAVKALVVSRGLLAAYDRALVFQPAFINIISRSDGAAISGLVIEVSADTAAVEALPPPQTRGGVA